MSRKYQLEGRPSADGTKFYGTVILLEPWTILDISQERDTEHDALRDAAAALIGILVTETIEREVGEVAA